MSSRSRVGWHNLAPTKVPSPPVATGEQGSALIAAPSGPDRVRWVDAGRGIAIVLVVFYHAAQWLDIAGFRTQAWEELNLALATLRMPLFFTISGMFASKWLGVSWSRLWSGKVSLFAWVFMLWTFLSTGPFILGLIMDGQSGNFFAQYRYVVLAPFAPRFELWFIWALALFFVLARITQTLPAPIQVASAAALSAVALSGWDLGNVGWSGACKYYFFFLLGLHYRSSVLAVGRSRRHAVLAAVAAVWALMAASGVVLDLNQEVAGFYFLTAILGVVTGVSASRVLARSETLRGIGQRTLPVYLTHTSIILVAAWCLHFLPLAFKTATVASVIVPLVSAAAVTAGLWLARRRTFSSYAFEAPHLFRHGRLSSRTTN